MRLIAEVKERKNGNEKAFRGFILSMIGESKNQGIYGNPKENTGPVTILQVAVCKHVKSWLQKNLKEKWIIQMIG